MAQQEQGKNLKRPTSFWRWCMWIILGIIGFIVLLFIILLAWVSNDYPNYQLYDWNRVDIIPGQANQLFDGKTGKTTFNISIRSVVTICDWSHQNVSPNPRIPYELGEKDGVLDITFKKLYTGGKQGFLDTQFNSCNDPRNLRTEIPDLQKGKTDIMIHDGAKSAQVELSVDKGFIHIRKVSDPDNLIRIPFAKVKLLERGVLVTSTKDLMYKEEANNILRGVSSHFFLSSDYFDRLPSDDTVVTKENPITSYARSDLKNNQNIDLPENIKTGLEKKGTENDFDYTFGQDERSIQDILKDVQAKLVNAEDIQYIEVTEYFMDGKKNSVSGK